MSTPQLPQLIPLRKKTSMACTNCRESKVRCERHHFLDFFCTRCIQRKLVCNFEKKTNATCAPAPAASSMATSREYTYPSTTGPVEFSHGESPIPAAHQSQQSSSNIAAAWQYQQPYQQIPLPPLRPLELCRACQRWECACPFQFDEQG